MPIKRTALVTALLLVAALQPASAQTLGQLQWVGTGSTFSSTFVLANYSQLTAYAGAAYRANALLPSSAPWYLQNSNGFGPAVDIYCIDFLHTANTSTYSAYFTNLGRDALTHTRSTDLARYQQVAWLTQQMDLQSLATYAGRQQRAVIHAAIWQIMNGTTQPRAARANGTGYGFEVDGIASWRDLAVANYQSVDLRNYTVVTSQCVTSIGHNGDGQAVSDNCGQEFLVRDGTVTPEPVTMVLLGTGLLAMAGMGLVTRGGFA